MPKPHRRRPVRPHSSPSGQASLPSEPSGVRLTTLPNGLVLILREDASAPVVSAQAWCRAGSIDEGRWLGAGLSHILEHMLFKGTTTRGSGRIDQEVQEAGGYMNAYTSFDRTVYWINVPDTGAKVAIDILCDIMQNATLPEEELAKEMDVIRREMDMSQDDPHHRSARRLFETAYTRSPYRFTIIGYPDIFGDVKREDIHAYYREKYAPNNLFFVVVGKINAAQTEEQIRNAFAGRKARALPPSVMPVEPRQIAPRLTVEEAPVELGHAHLSWHIPDMRHPDVAILDVLATLLGGGRSSRLYQELREKRGVVHSVDAWTYNPGNPGLFGVSAIMDGPQFEAACSGIFAEVERMKSKPVSAAELSKAIKQFVAGTLASRKTMQGQAQDLGGNWMAAGDLNFSERYLAAVKGIIPGDLQRVARAYLTDENRNAYALLPNGATPPAAARVEAHQEEAIHPFELDNGLRLLLREDHRLPFVEFRLVLKGGILAENAANNGITLLMARTLLQGTKSRTGAEIASAIESVGGHLDTYGGNNSFGLSAEVLSNDVEVGLHLLADVLLHPAFPKEGLMRERQIQLAAIRAQRDELLSSAGRLMRQTMFGQAGYGLLTQGSEASVRAITSEQLRAFHASLTLPNNAVLAVFGDIRIPAMKAALERKFRGWKRGIPALGSPQPAGAATKPRRAEETRDKKQAVLVVGFPGTQLDHPDRFALELIQEACSDLGSRLFLRIREKLGLAYYVGAQNFLGMLPGYFVFYVGTEPDKAELVEAQLLQEAEWLRQDGLTPEELKRAKAKVIGQKKISRQDLGHCASTSALDELYGLGYLNFENEDAHYEAVTIEDVQTVARRYLRPESVVIAWIRPEKSA